MERAIAGLPTTRVHFGLPALMEWGQELTGRQVLEVETRGKAMLTHFEGGLTVYSHNQLYGKWIVCRPDRPPRTTRSLRLAIENDRRWALLYSASDIEVWPTQAMDDHPFLARLGPDALRRGLTGRAITRRLESDQFAGRSLAGLLLDQGFVAGLGNYLRSEILHVAGVHPRDRPRDLDHAHRRALGTAVLKVTRQSYRTGGITNDPGRARALKARGWSRRAYRHHVFGREGEPCFNCEADTISKSEWGGRRVYFCPTCQPERRR